MAEVGYWLLTAFLVLVIVCLGIVAYQRDTARSDLETYRCSCRGARTCAVGARR